MRDDLPSLTAMLVAFGRGLSGSGRGEPLDPAAEQLLPKPLATTLRLARGLAHERPLVERGLSLLTLDTFAHAGLRTHAIDAALEASIDAGTRQLVIVGAGLDARGYRLPSLADVRVFEVDHPATQRLKKAKARALSRTAREVVHVAVDFGRDSLADALARAGHDPGTPTTWIWEGVTMYLPIEAIRATLRVIDARSAARSRLVVTYVEPTYGAAVPESLRPAVRALFRAIGEPLLGEMPGDAMHRELGAHGFAVVSDTSSRDWIRMVPGASAPLVPLDERVVVADRRD